MKKAHKDNKVPPSCRQASEFDFFDIFDDGTCCCEQQFKKIKAFTDVGNIESMSKERWGAAKWVKGQLRLYCVNGFDAAQEPKDDMPIMQKQSGQHGYVSHKDFMKMLDNVWFAKEASPSNVMAVLKRTHLFIQTKKLSLCEAGRCFYRKGRTDLPPDFQQKVAWEMEWMNKAMAGRPDEVPLWTTFLGNSLFGASQVAAPCSTLTRKRTCGSLQAASTPMALSNSPPRARSMPWASLPSPVAKAEPSDKKAGLKQDSAIFPMLRPSTSVTDISDSPWANVIDCGSQSCLREG